MIAAISAMEQDQSQLAPKFLLSPIERSLLRLMVNGYTLEEASLSLGLTPLEAHTAVYHLQTRCGASNVTRLIVLAILNAWV